MLFCLHQILLSTNMLSCCSLSVVLLWDVQNDTNKQTKSKPVSFSCHIRFHIKTDVWFLHFGFHKPQLSCQTDSEVKRMSHYWHSFSFALFVFALFCPQSLVDCVRNSWPVCLWFCVCFFLFFLFFCFWANNLNRCDFCNPWKATKAIFLIHKSHLLKHQGTKDASLNKDRRTQQLCFFTLDSIILCICLCLFCWSPNALRSVLVKGMTAALFGLLFNRVGTPCFPKRKNKNQFNLKNGNKNTNPHLLDAHKYNQNEPQFQCQPCFWCTELETTKHTIFLICKKKFTKISASRRRRVKTRCFDCGSESLLVQSHKHCPKTPSNTHQVSLKVSHWSVPKNPSICWNQERQVTKKDTDCQKLQKKSLTNWDTIQILSILLFRLLCNFLFMCSFLYLSSCLVMVKAWLFLPLVLVVFFSFQLKCNVIWSFSTSLLWLILLFPSCNCPFECSFHTQQHLLNLVFPQFPNNKNRSKKNLCKINCRLSLSCDGQVGIIQKRRHEQSRTCYGISSAASGAAIGQTAKLEVLNKNTKKEQGGCQQKVACDLRLAIRSTFTTWATKKGVWGFFNFVAPVEVVLDGCLTNKRKGKKRKKQDFVCTWRNCNYQPKTVSVARLCQQWQHSQVLVQMDTCCSFQFCLQQEVLKMSDPHEDNPNCHHKFEPNLWEQQRLHDPLFESELLHTQIIELSLLLSTELSMSLARVVIEAIGKQHLPITNRIQSLIV